ncbi:MAG: amidase [Thaumarchaeota archaeon]|nr:amidase [Nitrososphaerota archaeon]
MSGQKTKPVVGLIVAVLILAAVGAVGYYQFEVAPRLATSSTSAQAACTPSTCVNITIPAGAGTCSPAPCGFSPAKVVVVIGQNGTVFWKNDDSAHHTVTGAGSFGSPDMGLNAVYSYHFTVAGNYSYVCNYHPWMRASVLAKAP